MNDEEAGSGLGSLAMYELGRLSAKSDAQRGAFVDIVRARRRQRTDAYNQLVDRYNELQRENDALRVENGRLSRNYDTVRGDLDKLKEWADWAEDKIHRQAAK